MTFDRIRDDLPWGYWLRVVPATDRLTLADDDGRTWSSVRSAFWNGSCGFEDRGNAIRDAQLEHLLALLNVDPHDGHRLHWLEMDVARDDAPHAEVVSNWIVTSGLVEYDDRGGWTPTPEGHAVARMLIATRSPALPAIHPAIEARHSRSGEHRIEIDRAAFQRREAGRMTFAFTRETIVDRPAISLLFRDVRAPLPLVRTLWVQTFPAEPSRDAFFAWLTRNADRWNALGERANRSGAHALTQHLVAIITAEFMTPDQADTPPGSAIEHRAEERWRPQTLAALRSSGQEAGGDGTKSAQVDHVVCGQKMEAVYHVAELQPEADGPWRSEAEKIAWTDRSTGVSCICRRDAGGHLWGFAAVQAGHPLFGVEADAIPRTRIKVHGGLRYSALCDTDNSEALSICHVASDQSSHDGTDEKWWFGFACDGLYDLIPNLPAHAAKARDLGIPQTYRDEAYVYVQATDLAAQLAAIASGEREGG